MVNNTHFRLLKMCFVKESTFSEMGNISSLVWLEPATCRLHSECSNHWIAGLRYCSTLNLWFEYIGSGDIDILYTISHIEVNRFFPENWEEDLLSAVMSFWMVRQWKWKLCMVLLYLYTFSSTFEVAYSYINLTRNKIKKKRWCPLVTMWRKGWRHIFSE